MINSLRPLALLCFALAPLTFLSGTAGQEPQTAEWTVRPYHLTARPWAPLAVPRSEYLDVLAGLCRFSIRHQDSSGAIIDPFLKGEHQYATPYFAYAVGTLISEGREHDLLPNGLRAMERATAAFAGGRDNIPDRHGEFFIAPLTGALGLYKEHADPSQWQRWSDRLKLRRVDAVLGRTNNWETYVMKGEWMRFQSGLIDREAAVEAAETAWRERQRARIAAAPFFLYHDFSSVPDTLSVEAVGRGNMLALIHAGYDGPSAAEIRKTVESGTRTALLLQDPSGQTPANGRTDDHVWVDIGNQLGFEVMAERAHASGDSWGAGQFRRAAMLAFRSAQRWRRTDEPWAGSFYVTKNHFDPALRVGYQLASQYSNYNGSLMFHLAEAYHARKTPIAEQPAPSEIGGYAVALDSQFASVLANAGGMQLQANLRGQTEATHGNFWTPLGVVRLSRRGWDTRLGPSDGAITSEGGVSFAPTFLENGRWLRLADLSDRYEGAWAVEFVHPVLVRCSISYTPKPGRSGPSFRNDFIITPDGVLSTLVRTTNDGSRWGVTWPVLESDGRPLKCAFGDQHVSVQYPDGADQQTFLALHENPEITVESRSYRSTYGDLRPVRVTVPEGRNRTFVYPRSESDPAADLVRKSFVVTQAGFKSVLARVDGNVYVGRTSAGGFGHSIDLNADGKPDATFTRSCGFLLHLRSGRVAAIEADREVDAIVQGKRLTLKAFTPVVLNR